MTAAPDDPGSNAPTAVAHRSRWRRYSPSMGWPAFWSEILIVVLGVVIALAANEAVQEWNWRNKVNEAEGRLKPDLDALLKWYAEAVAAQPCVEAQLDELRRRVLQSGDVLQPAPEHVFELGMPLVVRAPHRSYAFGTWDALGAEGTAIHFARDRQARLNRIARGATRAREHGWEFQRMLGRLEVMRDAIPLDPVTRAELLRDVGQSRLLNANMAVIARQQMNDITEGFGTADSAHVDAFIDGGPRMRESWRYSGTVAFCKEQGLPLADWQDVIDPAAAATPPSPAAPP